MKKGMIVYGAKELDAVDKDLMRFMMLFFSMRMISISMILNNIVYLGIKLEHLLAKRQSEIN
ncbi:hypothetical protein A6V39_03450 [Candidatus Mycoplasma haematobovis]|uniref:Uncharacterized protein n=1 Tax=Candidatus Mycoplasma haematobovis TaxID=432608 RepID=A0A1A9QD52_9MOLU|nr:hypothetical protein A6V39_03450 [Candidatus Mycoplasma haematobovis]